MMITRSCLPFLLLAISVFPVQRCFSQAASTLLPSEIRRDSIHIVRDHYGVPHIYAPTDEEVTYGFMWAGCEDDFENVQKSLLLAKAMSGRVNGKEGAISDYVVQLLRIRERVAAAYDTAFSPKFKRILTASCLAVNRYAELFPKEVLIKKAFPVTEHDIVEGYVLATTFMSTVGEPLKQIFENKLPKMEKGAPAGSNGIAVHSSRTSDGKNYIAINSHQPLEGIFSWYEAHLCSGEGMNILGSSLIGAISLNQGANEHLAWAHTLNFPDLFDIYRLEMHPSKKDMYRYDGAWKKLDKKKAKIRVKIASWLPVISLSKAAYQSVHGPVIKTKHGVYALRGPSFIRIGAAEQWYHMAKARNFTEFRKALELQQIAAMNIVYADRYDTIFYISNGLYPSGRNEAYNWQGVLPGDTSATVWNEQRYLPIDSIPKLLNPACGYLYSTNQSPFLTTREDCNLRREDFPESMGNQYRHFNRSKRLIELMDTVDVFSWEIFKKIKYDMVMPDTVVFITSVEKFRDLDPEKYPDLRDAITVIRSCRRTGDTTNADVSLFLLAFMELQEQVEFGYEFVPHSIVLPDSIYAVCLRNAKKHLLKHYGTLQVPLGQLQRIRRGNKDMALPGLPDVLAAMYSEKRKDGTLKPGAGESYILLARLDKDGVELESVNAYGSSNKKESPHYNDQMELFVKQRTKPMSLDRSIVWKNAERIYHPQ